MFALYIVGLSVPFNVHLHLRGKQMDLIFICIYEEESCHHIMPSNKKSSILVCTMILADINFLLLYFLNGFPFSLTFLIYFVRSHE